MNRKPLRRNESRALIDHDNDEVGDDVPPTPPPADTWD